MTDTDDDLPPDTAPIRDAIANAEEDLPRPLGPISKKPPSIIPLGQVCGVYYFISQAGEQRQFTARELVRLNIASLFGGNTAWLCVNFPVFNKKGNVIDGQFNANNAAEWLMLQCGKRELFNPNTLIRRSGVWRHRDELIAHLGKNIWHQGKLQPAGVMIGGAIYPAINSATSPDFASPSTSHDAKILRASFNAWNFTEPYDADLLLGYTGASMLGAYPVWRVHALVTGERGSGKSALGELIFSALGPQGSSMTDYSEAGIRQSLTNEARALWLDEGESASEEQATRMAKVIALMRQMSGGAGAKIARGSSGGTAISYTVTGSVLITAINPPGLQPQDRSRILTVPLNMHSVDRSSTDIRLMCDEAAQMSARLRARALIGYRRFGAAFEIFRSQLTSHGCDGRQADMFAALLAGRSLLVDDEVPTGGAAMQWVNKLEHRLRLIMFEDRDQSDAQSCLNHLLDAPCEAIRDGIKRTIGQIVAHGMRTVEQPENEKLMPQGLRIVLERGDKNKRALFVANDHTALKRVFHNTAWESKNWRASLLRLPGVAPSPVPISVGRKSRGVLIPASLLPLYESGDDYDPSPPDPAPPGVIQ